METAVSNTKNRHFTTEIATFDDITVSKSQIENGEVYMITFEENVSIATSVASSLNSLVTVSVFLIRETLC